MRSTAARAAGSCGAPAGIFLISCSGGATRPWLDAAPIPGLNLGQNVLFHEYEVVRRATNHPAFQPVERSGYLRELASSLWYVEDPVRREELRKTLEQHGWRSSGEHEERKTIGQRPTWLRQAALKTLDNTSAWIFGDRMKARKARTSLRKFLVNRLHLAPADICGFDYATDAEAVSQALRLAAPAFADESVFDVAERG